MVIGTYILIITLNVNGLNAPTKRHRLADWIQNQDPLNKMDLIDIYRTCHPKTTEYTFFSSAYGTFSRIDHILGHKSTFGKFKKIENVSSIFSNHNAVR